MKIIQSSTINPVHKTATHDLWNKEYPAKLKHGELKELDDYLSGLADVEYHLLTSPSEEVVGWALRFSRNNQPWFAVVIDSNLHGQGHGRRLLDEMKKHTAELNGWVIDHNKDLKENGEYYRSPLGFYLKNEFIILPETRLELEKMSAVAIRWVNKK
jgi:GNAT superfamily N-acetyltransferase